MPTRFGSDRGDDAPGRIRFRTPFNAGLYLADGIAADYDAAGCLAGLEILDVRRRVGGADAFRQIILEGVGGLVPGQTVPHP